MTVTLKIEKTVYGGDGLGRLGDGRVAFVPGAYAGETVKAEIVEQKKRFVKTRLVGVEEAIPERLAEKGPTVPGMVYADVAYDAEIRFKQDQLENFLWKVAQTVLPLEVVPAVAPLAYRNKVVYHTERQHGRWVLGYREEPDHRVVDVTQDPLACPAINAALPSIRSAVFTLLTQGARAVRQSAKAADNVTIRHTARDGVKWWPAEPPTNLELCEQTAGLKVAVPADGFYQVNPQMAFPASALPRTCLTSTAAWACSDSAARRPRRRPCRTASVSWASRARAARSPARSGTRRRSAFPPTSSASAWAAASRASRRARATR